MLNNWIKIVNAMIPKPNKCIILFINLRKILIVSSALITFYYVLEPYHLTKFLIFLKYAL